MRVFGLHRERNVRFIASILLAIISLYYVNSTMFSHTHEIEGATIVHSHFYGGDHASDEEGGCKHTESELTLIQHLSNIILLKSESIHIVEVISAECRALYIPKSIEVATLDIIGQSSPRAPPIVA